MQILRYSKDMYGREVLEGISWDLLPLFFGIALVAILGHLTYRFITDAKQKK